LAVEKKGEKKTIGRSQPEYATAKGKKAGKKRKGREGNSPGELRKGKGSTLPSSFSLPSRAREIKGGGKKGRGDMQTIPHSQSVTVKREIPKKRPSEKRKEEKLAMFGASLPSLLPCR